MKLEDKTSEMLLASAASVSAQAREAACKAHLFVSDGPDDEAIKPGEAVIHADRGKVYANMNGTPTDLLIRGFIGAAPEPPKP